jgi:hypothetical protein
LGGLLGYLAGIGQAIGLIVREEGFTALWKGITPRLMRIMPGQAITFMTYEFVRCVQTLLHIHLIAVRSPSFSSRALQ